MKTQYELARLPKNRGGVRYEPAGQQPDGAIASTAIYIEQDFLRRLPAAKDSDTETASGFPKRLTITIEVAQDEEI